MKRQEYLDLQKRQQQELTDFPIAYAFDEKQLQEALKKLGAEKSECVTVFGHGDIVKKTDAPKLLDMLKRHTKELQEALKDEEFAEAAFLYEMDNHEYAINWDGDADVLACFSLDEKMLLEMGLDGAYRRARRAHMKHAQEWDMI
jgi:hypothetical protein